MLHVAKIIVIIVCHRR